MRLTTKYSATAVTAMGLAALVLAACGGGDSSSGSSDSGSSGGSAAVSVKSVDKSDVLADSQGKTLYTANVEKGGQIMCTGQCTSFWMPAEGSAAQAKSAAADLNLNLGTVKRPDGKQQLALDGKPLYSFTQEGAGKLTGNGFEDAFNGTQFTWSAATKGASASSGGSSGYRSGY